MFKCVVSADLFRRVALARSDESIRYYLKGVYITPHAERGALLVATNGHWLVVIHDQDAIVEGSAIVSLNKQLMAALKSSRDDIGSKWGHKTQRVVVVKDDKAMIVLSGLKHEVDGNPVEPRQEAFDVVDNPDRHVVGAQFAETTIDGTFPDWTRVVPKDVKPDNPFPVIDQKYLALASKAISEDTKGALKFLTSESLMEPIIAVPANKPFGSWEGMCVLMPLRDDKPAHVPTFWKTA